MISFSRFNYCI
uniref:Uncharacterized protein n=1 Tax=Arundo donax TaxID=35708 RepID=A0A0A9ASS9_ARUDO